MKGKYRLAGIASVVLLGLLVGLTYVGGGFKRIDWLGSRTVSGLQIEQDVVWELLENKVSVERLRNVLGEPAFEFVGSASKVLIYRSVNEDAGGTRTLFGIMNLGDDYTTIEDIWIIEVVDDHVSAYQRVNRVYYPVRAKDLTFGLDNSAYGEYGYWIHNILPD